MGSTTANLFGGGGGEEVDWRGIPIQKKEQPAPIVENVEEQIKSLELQIEALKKRLVDSEGAD